MPKATVILNAPAIQRTLTRIAHEIAERNEASAEVVLVGIQRGGGPLAERLATLLAGIWGNPVPCGHLDVSMHRDDLDQRAAPEIHPTVIPFDVNGKTVVLVDDVLFSGRTIRSALDKQLGEHWRTQVDLPELPIYESDERNSSLSWTWKKASVTVTLVGDGIVPLTISEKEIYDEIALFMHQKVFQVNKNLTIVITQKVDVTQLIALKKPIIPSKPDASLPRHYTIQTGDTWADLSQAFYGSTQHWRLLSDANQGGDLTVGRVLLIPIKP